MKIKPIKIKCWRIQPRGYGGNWMYITAEKDELVNEMLTSELMEICEDGQKAIVQLVYITEKRLNSMGEHEGW